MTGVTVCFFAGANAVAAACFCIACASGLARRRKPAPSSSTSSIAATRLATSVAVRHGRMSASGAVSGASTAALFRYADP